MATSLSEPALSYANIQWPIQQCSVYSTHAAHDEWYYNIVVLQVL